MCVVSHGYGELGGDKDGWYACGTKPMVLAMCRGMPEHFRSVRRYTDDIRSHCRPCAQLWVGSSRNWSAPVRCPCSQLAAFRGAPWVQLCLSVFLT